MPLYFAARPAGRASATARCIMRDDERMQLRPGEQVEMRMVRFRTLGCYPLTGAIESDAATSPTSSPKCGAARVRSARAA